MTDYNDIAQRVKAQLPDLIDEFSPGTYWINESCDSAKPVWKHRRVRDD